MMLLRNRPRAPLLLVVAMVISTSLYGMWYAYTMTGPTSGSWETSSPKVTTPGVEPQDPSPDYGSSTPAEGDHPQYDDPGSDSTGGGRGDEEEGDEEDDKYEITSKIAKVTVAANKLDNDMIRRSLMTHKTQNKLHGYQHFIANNQAVSDLIEHDRGHRPKGAWTKPAYILSLIVAELEKPEEDRLEWLFWFDADTAVMNPHIPLDVFLPPKDDPELEPMDLMMASNWDGLNSGAFAIRVTEWSATLMSAVLAYPLYQRPRMQKDRFRDQSAFQFLLEHDESPMRTSFSKGREHWAVPSMRWFNALPVNNAFDRNKPGMGWLFSHKMEGALFDNGTDKVFDDGTGGKIQPWKIMRGDMIVHFAGTTAGGTRDSWMGPWLDRAEALLPEWADKSTADRLRTEAAKFWKDTSARVKKERIEAEKKQAEYDAEQKRKKEEEDKRKAAEEAAKKEAEKNS